MVDLLPDRASESFSAWLKQHPEIVTQRLERAKGKRLLRKRGELIERTFAHCYETVEWGEPTCDNTAIFSNGC